MTTPASTTVPATARGRLGILVVCASLGAVSAVGVQGQSVFNAAGLGVPSEALDGRSRAMGSMGIGLPGGAFMPTDPAALGRLTLATGVVATQPSWTDFSTDAGRSGSFQANRFPLMGLAYPLFGGMMSFQIGSFLDQHYTDARTGSVELSTRTVPYTDDFVQDGSVSNLNLGYARMLGSDVSMGLTVGRYAGSVVRTLTRTYTAGEGVTGGGVDSYVERGTWSYTGHHVSAGLSADVTDWLHASASLQIPTALDATASDETEGGDRSFDLPAQFRGGMSASFDFGLLVGASVAVADWSAAQNDLSGSGRAGDANGVGAGIEFSRARLLGRDAPLRFGYRRSTLPFSFGDEEATERIFSGGVGLALNRSAEAMLASVDLALERGRRWTSSISESFWRMTLSFQAAGR